MKCISALLLLVCSSVCFAQTPQIKSGATVYIEPMAGYETYLAAAMVKQHVLLVVVTDKEKATYIIRSTVTQPQSQPTVVVNNGRQTGGYEAALAQSMIGASIAVIDSQSSAVVFAYTAGRGLKGSAETCAKHLKEFIEKKK